MKFLLTALATLLFSCSSVFGQNTTNNNNFYQYNYKPNYYSFSGAGYNGNYSFNRYGYNTNVFIYNYRPTYNNNYGNYQRPRYYYNGYYNNIYTMPMFYMNFWRNN